MLKYILTRKRNVKYPIEQERLLGDSREDDGR